MAMTVSEQSLRRVITLPVQTVVCTPSMALRAELSARCRFRNSGFTIFAGRPERLFLSGFATHDRANMRLRQTDNPLINAPRMIVKHRSLLIVKGSDQEQLF